MKNTFALLLILFIYTASVAQSIPNGSFEDWKTVPFPSYEDPTQWNTPNKYTALALSICVKKSDDAVDGNYSARLETVEINIGENTFQAPGLVTYADFEIDFITQNYTFGGGIFLQKKVSKLKGKYKYQSAENDSASVLIYCFSHPEGEKIDTIGAGLAYLHDATEWTDFSVNMQYFNNHTPDTFNVLIMSSGTFEIGYMPPGSVLYIDNLTIDTLVNSIGTNNARVAKHFPNPVNDKLIIELEENEQDRNLKVFDINGQLVKEIRFSGSSITFDVSSFQAGIYTYHINDTKALPYKGTFIKQ